MLPLATIQFRIRRLNSSMMHCRISARINSMIFLICSFIWKNVAGFISCFNHSKNTKHKNPIAQRLNVAPAHRYKMAMEWLKDVSQSVSRGSDLVEVRIHLTPMFTRSETLTFLSFGLFERWKQEENILLRLLKWRSQSNPIIESIPAKIMQRVIGKFSRSIRNCIVAKGWLFEKLIDTCNTTFKYQVSFSSCFIYLRWILELL